MPDSNADVPQHADESRSRSLTPTSERLSAKPTPEAVANTFDDAGQRPLVTPPIDIFEDEAGLVLIADLPGVSSQTADIQMEDSRLSLFGRLEADLPKDAVPLHEEFAVADFLRSFILSDQLDHDRIEANLTSGVLTIRLPRAERSQPRRIEINSK